MGEKLYNPFNYEVSEKLIVASIVSGESMQGAHL